MALVETNKLTRLYQLGNEIVTALLDVTLSIDVGEFVGVMGPSGSGKSTFMNVIGCLDRPTSGSFRFDGREMSTLDADQRAAVRCRQIGFVFQQFNLLQRMSAVENVELPMIYAGIDRRLRRQRASAALDRVGLGTRIHHRPMQLSGGQQQRVAIARALVTEPRILLADEPTGALDSRTSVELMALFQSLNHQGVTIVMVTHEPDIAAYARRIIRFLDGRVVNDALQEPADAAKHLALMIQPARQGLVA